MNRRRAIGLLLLVVIAAAYWRAPEGRFLVHHDDDVYVTRNPHVTGGLTAGNAAWAFTRAHGANWHPLTWISHQLDVALYGLDPRGHHMTSLLLHGLNTLLLFLLLARLTGTVWRAAFAAALFAVHPLHVESVAWVAERKDVLSTSFWMLALWAYVGYAEKPGPRRYLAVLVLFVLGLLSKPMVVTLPFVLLLLDYWPLGRFSAGGGAAGKRAAAEAGTGAGSPSGRSAGPASLEHSAGEAAPAGSPRPGRRERSAKKARRAAGRPKEGAPAERARPAKPAKLILEKLPFMALAAASCAVTLVVQKEGGAVQPFPFAVRIGNALVSYVSYTGKTLWPRGLSAIYPHPESSLPSWKPLAAAAVLVAVTALVLRFGRRRPYLPVGWFWYAGTLVPVIGIVQVGNQAMADRYTYIPLIGLFIMAAFGIPDLVLRRTAGEPAAGGRRPSGRAGLPAPAGGDRPPRRPGPPARVKVLGAAAAAVIVALAAATHVQVGYWKDSPTLFRRALAVTENNHLAELDLGMALVLSGEPREGLGHLEEAVRIKPDFGVAWADLAMVYLALGNPAEAWRCVHRAEKKGCALSPSFLEKLAAAMADPGE